VFASPAGKVTTPPFPKVVSAAPLGCKRIKANEYTLPLLQDPDATIFPSGCTTTPLAKLSPLPMG
jgi:hypothetical protein